MRKTFVLSVVLAALLLVGTTASASQNAGSAWNQYAAQFGFGTYPQTVGTRFVDAYSGSNFAADFAGIIARVSQALGTEPPTIWGDDLLDAKLESWPDGSGM